MGGFRRTRSFKARGLSQPPSVSFTTFRSYFTSPPMPPGGMDKMAPAASTSHMRTPPQPAFQAPAQQQGTPESARMASRIQPPQMDTMSLPQHPDYQAVVPHGTQPAALGLTPTSYTVYRHLPAAAAHSIRPRPDCWGSKLSLSFSGLPTLTRPHANKQRTQSSHRPSPRGDSIHTRPTPLLLPLPNQRQSRYRDPGSSGRGADHIFTYAQAVSSSFPAHTGDRQYGPHLLPKP